MASIGWIDFSQSHRKKVLSVMDLYKDRGMVDEMGLGTVRDAFSDLIFPGTSTLHTRSKYFVLIPQLIIDLESQNIKSVDFTRTLIREEKKMIYSLMNGSRSHDGIIGQKSREELKRTPSTIYWNGLRRWGILSKYFTGSVNDYGRQLGAKHKKRKYAGYEEYGDDRKDDKDAQTFDELFWWNQIPMPESGWKEKLNIRLTKAEAIFLEQQVLANCQGSLLCFILEHNFNNLDVFHGIHDFINQTNIYENLNNILKVATDFDFIMKGAVIRYNLLVQQKRNGGDVERWELVWKKWNQDRKKEKKKLGTSNAVWAILPHIGNHTKQFVNDWYKETSKNELEIEEITKLVKSRELMLKKPRRSRLENKDKAQKTTNDVGITVHQDLSTRFLDYRWSISKNLLQDIFNSLD